MQNGIFARHNLDVELINYAGATDQLLEAIATGKADAGVGMALRWLKPLEQGFDVKLTAGTHGGCMRLLAARGGPVTDLASLKGKTIATADMASPAKNFFAIMLTKGGIDPERDVEWRQYPADLLNLAIEKGEAQALVEGDPRTYLWLKDDRFVEIASNLSDEYANRLCCVLGIRGSLIRDDRPTAAALTKAVLEAAEWTSQNPAAAAAVFAPYTPKAGADDLTAMMSYHTHHHHPVGLPFKQEIALYAEELKLVSVFKRSTVGFTRFCGHCYAAEWPRPMVAALHATVLSGQVGVSVDVRDVSQHFQLDGQPLHVLDRVSFSVEPGDFVALLGPSGCGKSSLLRLVAGLDRGSGGEVLVDGHVVTGPDPSRILMFQDPTLFPWRTVWDNIALGPEARGALGQRCQAVDEALRLVGLCEFATALPHQLSGGMAQRAALAHALVNEPRLLILDEPLGKLDSLTRIAMQAELVRIWQQSGFTGLLVTHDVEEALYLARRVLVFSDRPGRVAAEVVNDRPYPRHRGDPHLAELRHCVLSLLGLDASW